MSIGGGIYALVVLALLLWGLAPLRAAHRRRELAAYCVVMALAIAATAAVILTESKFGYGKLLW